MHSYAEYSNGVASDDYIPILRELMAWDALCPNSCVLHRNDLGILGLKMQPSPLHWSRQKEWPWAIKESDLKPWHNCLDIGGSWSVFKYALARRTRSVVCLDLEEEAIRKSIESQQVLGVGRISHVCADCRRLPFPDAHFDRAFCISVLEHMETGHLQAIDEMRRVLRPGGIAMLSLDVALEGKGNDNFYVGPEEMGAILERTNIRIFPERKRTNGAKMQEGAVIAAVLMRLVK